MARQQGRRVTRLPGGGGHPESEPEQEGHPEPAKEHPASAEEPAESGRRHPEAQGQERRR